MNTRHEEPRLAGKHALVTDDAESAREILRTVLQGIGMRVTTASDGAEAVMMVRADPSAFDVILMDLVMERMDGIDAIREISPLLAGRRCPIIAMSADRRPEAALECLSAGARGEVLRKPFRAQAVISAVLDAVCGTGTADSRESPANDERVGQWSHLPQVPGCDVIGALERCGNDPALLRRLLQSFWEDGFSAFAGAQAAIQRGDKAGALKQLHKLRGEMLNLGLISLAAKLMAAESALQVNDLGTEARTLLAPDVTQPLMTFASRAQFNSTLTQISSDLRETLSIVKGLPALNVPLARELALTARGDEVQADGFEELVSRMVANDPEALALIPDSGRMLPGTYTADTDALFRQHAGNLDFTAAVRLLSPLDIRAPTPPASEDIPRVLLVDDAPVTVRLLATSLRGMGSLRFALSGEHAMEIALAWRPDLVIADVNMDGMSGIDLCRSLKEASQTSHCTVMLISANDDLATEVEGLTAGATDFIEKPLNPARIVGRVGAQLAAIKQRRESISILGSTSRDEFSGFVTCELDGTIIGVSPSLSALLGRATASYARTRLRDLFDPAFAGVLNDTLGTGKSSGTVGPFESAIRNSSGALLPVRILGRFMPSNGRRILWLGIEDIRERVLDERKRLDRHVSRTVATLTGGIAHEFNNLLGIVIGSLDLAIEANTDPDMALHLDRASTAALRAAGISRILRESAQRTARSSGLPDTLDKLIDRAWPILSNIARKGVTMIRQPGEQAIWVRLDAEELLSMLKRLVENACEAMPANTGTVRISTRAEPASPPPGAQPPNAPTAWAIVEVADSGEGMSEEVRSHALDPFFTTRSPDHIGLGLSEVNGIVARNGGSVEIESSPGAGCVVRLRFPAIA